MSSKKKLSELEMPMPTPENPDTSSGLPQEEEGLEEGDLVMDYAMPLRSLFKGGLVTAGKMALGKVSKEKTGSLVKDLRDRGAPAATQQPANPVDISKAPVLDYGEMNKIGPGPGKSGKVLRYSQEGAGGQMGPGTTTDASKGMDLPARKGRGSK